MTDGGVAAGVNSVGAGKLSVGDAVNAAATLDPATISFGPIGAGALPIRRTLNITNVGGYHRHIQLRRAAARTRAA